MDTKKQIQIIYILMVVGGLFAFPIYFAGVWAYLVSTDDGVLQSHLKQNKQTMWAYTGYLLVLVFAIFIIDLWAVLILFLWVAYRSVPGLMKLNEGLPVKPSRTLFGLVWARFNPLS